MRAGRHRFWWSWWVPAALVLTVVASACGGVSKAASGAREARQPRSQGRSAGHPTTRPAPTTLRTATTAPAKTAPAKTAPNPRAHATTTGPPSTAGHKQREPWVPTELQPTISQAAYALVDAWAAHDRSAALRDATPAAVAAIFSYPYPAGGPQYRGCSTPPANEPAACVWRSGNDLLSLTVKLLPGGYAVTNAILES